MPRHKSQTIDAWMRRHRNKHLCACGCGLFIDIKREHYRLGIPSFLKNHNLHGVYNPQTENESPKKITLWDKISEEDRQRRLSQLKNFPKGEEHPNWSGGKYLTESGYLYIKKDEHPHAVSGYVPEHRAVVEEWMVNNAPDNEFLSLESDILCLKRDTVVHHRSFIKTHNILENLVCIRNVSIHAKWHAVLEKRKTKDDGSLFETFRKDIFCPWIKDTSKPPLFENEI